MAMTAGAPVALPSHVAGPTAKRTKTIRMPPKVVVGDLTPNNIGTLRKLNSVLFPVAYSDRFYKEVLSSELEDYNKLVYYNDIPVGAICCRIEMDSSADSASTANKPMGKLYLMTLGVLAPYRRQGLASKLLSHVARKAQEASLAASLAPPPTTKPISTTSKVAAAVKGKGKAADPTKETSTAPETPKPVLKSIFVHVQLGNEDAKTFWQGQGFTESETIQKYYKPTIEGSRDAWLLEKAIKLDD